MRVEEKLGADKFDADKDNPHIIVVQHAENIADLRRLVQACPAGLYHEVEGGDVRLDFEECLECGTCRVLGLGNVVTQWQYPEGAMGVEYRYG
ncbi:MAG: 4Fe-4S dicluster domain-containing protein [Propionibacteriaceae bacterium]|nr:4Fe-4S dicluster domain-containing protein [Propionibacteriaceae bacterium]